MPIPLWLYHLRQRTLIQFLQKVIQSTQTLSIGWDLLSGLSETELTRIKPEFIAKIGWLAFGWGVVLVGLALIHGEALNPTWPRLIEVNPIAYLYFGLLFGGIGLMFVGEGSRAIMELASIVSHILSYTRLVGILLASVILAHTTDFIFLKAINISIPFAILGILILFIGHMFNIIIGVFVPGIQSARLIYVEFFSKFYHGNGIMFNPFGSVRQFTYEQYTLEQSAIQPKKKTPAEPKIDQKKR